MRHIVVGTAGHIDHGKSALVRALTGMEPDRLEEEKRRGISIELGFAHLTLSSEIRIAFIDVPGHERFIKNMLAGVGGVDGVLLVVAANESIRPQTREHFEICRLLGVRQGVVALTKADLVDSEILSLVRLEIAELAESSFLETAAVVPVSSVTRVGLDELRRQLASMAVELPKRDTATYTRMPVDRCFTVQGFGIVATGTVVSGAIERESELQIYPGLERVRVRGLQVHGADADRARAGQRAALNVTGVEHEALPRGTILAEPGVFQTTSQFDGSLELLRSAKALKSGAPVHFHSGTAERRARVRLLSAAPALQPGNSALVRIVLDSPLLLLPGDRFIIRSFSPVTTIGGGQVVEIEIPPRQRRATAREHALKLVNAPDLGAQVAVLVSDANPGLSMQNVIARTGRRRGEILSSLPPQIIEKAGWLIAGATLERLSAEWETRLQRFHADFPLLPGMSKEAFRMQTCATIPTAVFDGLLASNPKVRGTGDVVHLANHRVAYREDEAQAMDKIAHVFAEAGLAVPSADEVLARCGVEMVRARSLLQILLRERRLVRVGADLVFHLSSLERLTHTLMQRTGQRFTVSEFKEWTGVSRKYAIPLLEYLDRQRLTYRDGDARVVAHKR